MGEGLAVEKKEIRNVSGSRGTKTQTNRDTYATTLRYIYDTRTTVVRNYSYLYRKFVAHCGSRKLNCDGSANGSRRVRDTCDDFAIVLRGVLSHKNFGHVHRFSQF